MAKKSDVKPPAPARTKSSTLVDTRVIYCGENLDVKVRPNQIINENKFQYALVPVIPIC
jgi:hypothetical protein